MKKHWRDLPLFAPPQAAAASDPLTIVAMKTWRVREPSSARSYTAVKLESRGGAVGFGEGGAVRGADVLVARPIVVGRRATESEFVRNSLAAMPALEAAVNNAMLDLMGRAKSLPVYQYLGGPTRNKARVLARLEGDREDALIESLKRSMSQGFRAFSFPIPARDTLWRMQSYTDAVTARFNRLKAAAGKDTDFVLDAEATLTPGDASFIATALERLHLLWLDEPTTVLSSDALSRITDESVMPLGLGRNVHDVGTFQNLLRWGCIDILRPRHRAQQHSKNPSHGGGRGDALRRRWRRITMAVQSRPSRRFIWLPACRTSSFSKSRNPAPSGIGRCGRRFCPAITKSAVDGFAPL